MSVSCSRWHFGSGGGRRPEPAVSTDLHNGQAVAVRVAVVD